MYMSSHSNTVVITKRSEQSKCTLVIEWIEVMLYIQSMEHY
jgi:hypothetical protein